MVKNRFANFILFLQSKTEMKAIVIGGTGATGAYLLQELLASDRITSVTALTRRAISVDHPRLNQQIVDFEQLEDVSISGDLAFSCLGTTRKAAGSKKAQWRVDHDYQLAFARMARKANVPVFTLMSSMGSDKNSALFYSRMKGTLEEAIIHLDFDHTYIFRPGMLERPGSDRLMERWVVSLMKGMRRLGMPQKYGPTHISIVAKAMVAASLNHDDTLKMFDVADINTLAQEKY